MCMHDIITHVQWHQKPTQCQEYKLCNAGPDRCPLQVLLSTTDPPAPLGSWNIWGLNIRSASLSKSTSKHPKNQSCSNNQHWWRWDRRRSWLVQHTSGGEDHLDQGCQTQFLEGRSPAEFCSNPAPTHKPCSFQISLKDLISWIRCV